MSIVERKRPPSKSSASPAVSVSVSSGAVTAKPRSSSCVVRSSQSSASTRACTAVTPVQRPPARERESGLLGRLDLVAQPRDHRRVDAGGEVEYGTEAAGLALGVQRGGQLGARRGGGLDERQLLLEHDAALVGLQPEEQEPAQRGL